MKDWNSLKERYLRDNLPVRLGNLASNLARIKSRSLNEANYNLVEGLLSESKFFIEWTASDADVEVAAQLVELQVQLARWQYRMSQLWNDNHEREKISQASGIWSERVLSLSGLLA